MIIKSTGLPGLDVDDPITLTMEIPDDAFLKEVPEELKKPFQYNLDLFTTYMMCMWSKDEFFMNGMLLMREFFESNIAAFAQIESEKVGKKHVNIPVEGL